MSYEYEGYIVLVNADNEGLRTCLAIEGRNDVNIVNEVVCVCDK